MGARDNSGITNANHKTKNVFETDTQFTNIRSEFHYIVPHPCNVIDYFENISQTNPFDEKGNINRF